MAKTYLGKENLPSLLTLIKTDIEKKVPKETGKGLSANDLTNALKISYDEAVTKVAALEAVGSEKNIIETVKVNGTAQTPDSARAVDITVPTTAQIKTQIEGYGYQTAANVESAITDKGYQTEDNVKNTVESYKYQTEANVKATVTSYGYQDADDVQAAINAALGEVTGIDIQVVETLPTTGEKGVIYLVAHSHSGSDDSYDEYVWIESSSSYEKIGNTDVDLSEYVKSSDLVELTADELGTMWSEA